MRGEEKPNTPSARATAATQQGKTEQRAARNKESPREAGFRYVDALAENGSPGWIRTTECLSQSQVPYRLATGL